MSDKTYDLGPLASQVFAHAVHYGPLGEGETSPLCNYGAIRGAERHVFLHDNPNAALLYGLIFEHGYVDALTRATKILTCPEASGREVDAIRLVIENKLDADDAIAVLKAAQSAGRD